MIIPDLLAQARARFPHKKAAVFPTGSLTFEELDARSAQVAARLRRLGIGRGDRVAFLSENSQNALIAYWGVMKRGAVSVDISTLAGVDTLAGVLDECAPAAAVVSARQQRRLTKPGVAMRLPHLVIGEASPRDAPECAPDVHTFADIFEDETVDGDVRRSDARELAMIVYTSGTTGRPKGVMLSHENLVSNICAANELMGLSSDDSILVVVPLYYIHGRMQVLTHALIGGTLAFSAGFHLPQQVLREIAEYQVSGFSGVPYHFQMLLERSSLCTTPLPHLRYMLITGGALSRAQMLALAEAVPDVALHTAYGQTEASPRVTYLGPEEVAAGVQSCGRPLPGVVVEILGEDDTTLPPGAVGEVVVSGPNIMLGYVSGDERSSGTIDAQGRLRTGDLGRLTDDGSLVLMGRKSEMIKVAGERIFPAEIEAVLGTHAAVADAAVVGVENALLGEILVAFVVPRAGARLTREDLHAHCLRSLPFVRAPQELRVVDAIPKTGSNKPDREALRARARAAPSPVAPVQPHERG